MPMPPVSVSRRRFFARAVSATLVAPFTLRHRYQVFAQSPRQYSDRVIRLVRESLVIDMLYDLGPPEMLKEKLATADPRYRVHGTRELVADLEGQNRVFELTAVLVRRGYTDDHVRLVLGENWRAGP